MTIRDIAISFGFEIDKASEDKANKAVDMLKSAATDALEEIGVGFEPDAASEERVNESVNQIKENAEQLAENKVGYKVDSASEHGAVDSIKKIRSTAVKLLGAIGIGFTVTKALKALAEVKPVAEAISKVKSQVTGWLKEVDNALGITKSLSQLIVKGLNKVMQVLRRVQDGFVKLAKRVGGVQKLLKLLAIAAGAIFVALNAKKILGFIKMLGRGIGGINAKMLLIAAVIAVIALLIDDLVNFMKGNNSLIGSLLSEKEADALRESLNGIMEAAKTLLPSLLDIGKTIGGVLLNAFKMIVPLLVKLVPVIVKILDVAVKLIGKVLEVIVDLLNDLMPVIEEIISVAVELIDEVLTVLIELIDLLVPIIEELIDTAMVIIRAVLPIITDLIKQLIPPIMQIIKRILPVITDLIQKLLPLVMSMIDRVLPVIIGLIEDLLPLIMRIINSVLPIIITLIEKWMEVSAKIYEKVLPILITLIEKWMEVSAKIYEKVLPMIIGVIEALLPLILSIIEEALPMLTGLLEALMPIITFVAELLGNVLGTAFEGLMPIIDALMGYLQGLITFITGVFTGDWRKAWEGVKQIFKSIAEGLVAVFKFPINGIIDSINMLLGGLSKIKIPDWVPGVGGKGINISPIPKLEKGSNNTPDTFIAGDVNGKGGELVTGAKGRKVFTSAATGDIFRTLRDIMSLGTRPKPETVAAASGKVENKSIVQNVDITNQFHGDHAGQKKSAEAMDKATDDATGLLARGLAYVR